MMRLVRTWLALALVGCSDGELTEACLKNFPVSSAEECLPPAAAELLLAQDPAVNNACQKLDGVEAGPSFEPSKGGCCYVVEVSPRDCAP